MPMLALTGISSSNRPLKISGIWAETETVKRSNKEKSFIYISVACGVLSKNSSGNPDCPCEFFSFLGKNGLPIM
jgi:hypothetical protein